jgi:membrane associated rhomboid family serine protease
MNGLRSMFPNIPILNKIMLANLICFAGINILFAIFGHFDGGAELLSDIFFLKENVLMVLITPWTLITYSFMHLDFWHFLGNMIFLYFTSIMFVQIFGEKKLLPFYLTAAVFGGILAIGIMNLIPSLPYALGASIVIFALLVAIGIMAPNMKVNLYFFIPIKLKWLVIFLIVMQLLVLGDSQFGHLSGVLFGLIFALYWKRGVNLTALAEKVIYKGRTYDTDTTSSFDSEIKSKYSFDAPNCPSCTTTKTTKIKNKKVERPLNVDEILDKINEKGIKSLTKREMEFLVTSKKK